jgi:hypothetical protein
MMCVKNEDLIRVGTKSDLYTSYMHL